MILCFIKVKLWTSSPRINQSGYKAFEQKQKSDKDELCKEMLLPILEEKYYTHLNEERGLCIENSVRHHTHNLLENSAYWKHVYLSPLFHFIIEVFMGLELLSANATVTCCCVANAPLHLGGSYVEALTSGVTVFGIRK